MTKVLIETAGCAANVADSEQMAGLLRDAKFEITESQEEADVIIINTCTVKNPTQSTLIRRLNELADGYKIVILAGCASQAAPKTFEGYPIIGTSQIHKVVEVVEEALNDNVVRELGVTEMPDLALPTLRRFPHIDIIPISRGCKGFCTFCKTKSARGNLRSYSVEDIVTRAKRSIQLGVCELWLTSQDTGCYGFDIGTDLPTLLEALVKIPGDFRIRVGMMNPDHMSKIQDRLIQIYKNPKVFKFLHLPAQAGHDEVLKNMKRLYTIEEFIDQIDAFRQAIPDITIATDIIVGFPGETQEQFYDTISLLRKITPDVVNISRFWPRPETPAARMKQVNGAEIKRRSGVCTDVFHNISRLQNEKWQDWEGEILLDAKGKVDGQWIGHTDTYKQVVVEGEYKLGERITVKIVKTDTFVLFGKDVNGSRKKEKVVLQIIN